MRTCRLCRAQGDTVLELDVSVTTESKRLPGPSALCVCDACGHVFTDVALDLAAYYAEQYDANLTDEGHDEIVTTKDGAVVFRTDVDFGLMQRIALARVPKAARVLEYGCGRGRILSRMRKAGFADVSAHDLSESYRAAAEALVGDDHVFIGARPEGPFDFAYSFFVLEHDADPAGALAWLHGAIAPGGSLFLMLPSFETNLVDLACADHVNHFTPAVLEALLEASGFDPVAIDTTSAMGAVAVLARRAERDPRPIAADPLRARASRAAIAPFLDYMAGVQSLAARVDPARPLYVYGAGFYATLTCAVLGATPSAVFDANPRKHGTTHLGAPVLAPERAKDPAHAEGELVVCVNPAITSRIAAELKPHFHAAHVAVATPEARAPRPEAARAPAEAPRLSVLVLRNMTVEAWAEPLSARAAGAGWAPTIAFAPLEAYAEAAFDPEGPIARGEVDVAVLALWLDALPFAIADGRVRVDAVMDHLRPIVEHLVASPARLVMVGSFVAPVGAGPAWEGWDDLAELNRRVAALAGGKLRLLDVAGACADLGRAHSIDARYWFLYRAPLTAPALERLAADVVAAAKRAEGRVKKVLALDCDGVLWGGVLGEDGPEGVALDAHSAPGNAFRAFQRQVLDLVRRGVLVVLVSKNDEKDVLAMLDEHPAMLLRREHVALWRVNWTDKATNLRALAKELSLSLDAFVFVDDSPAECALVRRELPMVEVFEAPHNATRLPLLFERYDGFALGSTDEDRARTALYKAEQRRAEAQASFSDLDGFLRSLDIHARIAPLTEADVARATELARRTNQFNLTTLRYTEDELRAMVAGTNGHLAIAMRVGDKFGDQGMTGLAVAAREGEAVRVEAMMLSCRVLGRRLEEALFAELVRLSRERWGAARVVAEYRRTPKNGLVEKFWDGRGLARASSEGDVVRYERDLSELDARVPEHIAIERR